MVQPTFLYGCVSWVLTERRKAQVRTLQRKMLRMIVGTGRRAELDTEGGEVLESWVAWVRRATAKAEYIKVQYNVPDWIDEVALRRFRWAGHVMRRSDGRWSQTFMEWSLVGGRRVGRPTTRWLDDIVKFFPAGGIPWQILAKNWQAWADMEAAFVAFAR